jgi:hypothetical protein
MSLTFHGGIEVNKICRMTHGSDDDIVLTLSSLIADDCL